MIWGPVIGIFWLPAIIFGGLPPSVRYQISRWWQITVSMARWIMVIGLTIRILPITVMLIYGVACLCRRSVVHY